MEWGGERGFSEGNLQEVMGWLHAVGKYKQFGGTGMERGNMGIG